jgi:hypothetical protein
MNFLRTKRANSHHQFDDDRPAKRISTPAGQRLSIILDTRRGKPASTAKISVTTESTFCNDPSHQHVGPVKHGPSTPRKAGFMSVLTGGRLNTPRESSDDVHNGSNLSVSVWSDRDEEKFGHVRQQRRRGVGAWGWKRVALVAALIVAIIILAVGLALGLKKKGTPRYASTALCCSGEHRILTYNQQLTYGNNKYRRLDAGRQRYRPQHNHSKRLSFRFLNVHTHTLRHSLKFPRRHPLLCCLPRYRHIELHRQHRHLDMLSLYRLLLRPTKGSHNFELVHQWLHRRIQDLVRWRRRHIWHDFPESGSRVAGFGQGYGALSVPDHAIEDGQCDYDYR